MAEPFIGEIRVFGTGTVPRGWMACEGQVMSISGNEALFSLLGTKFGGDGMRTFNLPDFRGRVPLGTTPNYPVGQRGGEEAHALTVAEMPAHTHPVLASSSAANQPAIANNYWASTMSYSDSPDATMASSAIATAGAGAPHNNMQPYQSLNFCIAIVGVYPSRN